MGFNELLEKIFVGFVSGLAVAVCGAYKDAPYEGFNAKTFWRSPLIGAVEAPIIASFFPDASNALLGLSTIATERLTVELWKIQRAKAGVYVPAKFRIGEYGKAHWSQVKQEV